MQGLKRLILAVAAIAVIAVPSPALAQEASESGYSPSDTAVVDPAGSHNSHTGGATAAADDPGTHTGGSLPFSGLDVLFLAVAGTGLAALGLGMRHLTRSPESA